MESHETKVQSFAAVRCCSVQSINARQRNDRRRIFCYSARSFAQAVSLTDRPGRRAGKNSALDESHFGIEIFPASVRGFRHVSGQLKCPEGKGVNVRPNHVADVPKSGANGDGWMDGWMDEWMNWPKVYLGRALFIAVHRWLGCWLMLARKAKENKESIKFSWQSVPATDWLTNRFSISIDLLVFFFFCLQRSADDGVRQDRGAFSRKGGFVLHSRQVECLIGF